MFELRHYSPDSLSGVPFLVEPFEDEAAAWEAYLETAKTVAATGGSCTLVNATTDVQMAAIRKRVTP